MTFIDGYKKFGTTILAFLSLIFVNTLGFEQVKTEQFLSALITVIQLGYLWWQSRIDKIKAETKLIEAKTALASAQPASNPQ